MSVTDSRDTELYYDTDEENIFNANWSHLADTDLLLPLPRIRSVHIYLKTYLKCSDLSGFVQYFRLCFM